MNISNAGKYLRKLESSLKENIYLFGDLVKSIETGLSEVIRWKKYTIEGAEIENDLQHSYSAALLAVIVIEAFEAEGWHLGKNAYRILACTLVHDIGEINSGDTHYINKTAKKDLHEIRSFEGIIDNLPNKIKNNIFDIFLTQFRSDNSRLLQSSGLDDPSNKIISNHSDNGQMDAKIFEAIERYGYVLYAFYNYKRKEDYNSEKLLIQVLRNQHRDLCRIANEFGPFKKYFYPQNIQECITNLLGISSNIPEEEKVE